MRKSAYFVDLVETYRVEIDDLLSDSEGKSVLQARLKEKRKAFRDLMMMMEYSPEMVAPAFYDAFRFQNPQLMRQALAAEPDSTAFPFWRDIAPSVVVADWAKPMVAAALERDEGDTFLTIAAALEFSRTCDPRDRAGADDDAHAEASEESDEDEDEIGLDEAGAEWMSEQGFDTIER